MTKRKLSEIEGTGQTVTVKLADVPQYLQIGELFQSMQSEEEESSHDADQIEVPANCIKIDQSVNSNDDAWSLLHSLRYWIAGTDLPQSLVTFCLSPGGRELPVSFWEAFASQFPSLSALQTIATDRTKEAEGKVRMAIATGDVKLVRSVHEAVKHEMHRCLPLTACSDAARTGSLACLQYVHERMPRNKYREVVRASIQAGSLEYLKFAVDEGYTIPADACILAAKFGRLDCLQHLFSLRGFDWGGCYNVCSAAALAGHLDCLRFAVENGDVYIAAELSLVDDAAEGGNPSCLEYLHELGVTWDEDACSAAASKDQLECLVYLHEHGCRWNEDTCAEAASIGSLRCLQYAHKYGCSWDLRTCNEAARTGALDCLRYAHEHGCPWMERTCAAAASTASLDCMQYAHERGCPWDSSTCTAAAGVGSLDCLQYACEHGCHWNSDTLAAGRSHPACRKYLQAITPVMLVK